MKNNWSTAINILKKNGVAIIPTDTIYGIVGSAFSKKTVDRIYKIKGRDENKPFIVLISSLNNLKDFGIIPHITVHHGEQCKSNCNIENLKRIFLPKVSVILPCSKSKFSYLHRGTKKIAFRLISKKNKNLFNLINKVGPIVAPSANPQGLKPAENIKEAKQYFGPARHASQGDAGGDKIDFYLNGGTKKSKSSTLIDYKEGKITVLRQGSVKI